MVVPAGLRWGMPDVVVRRMTTGDEPTVLAAAHLFDAPPVSGAVQAMLASETDHLLIALSGGRPVGFALAHELRRLDGTRPELFLYEIATDEAHRRQGVARRLIAGLRDLGRQRQARLMFVLTHAHNQAAMGLYAATGGSDAGEDATGIVMFDYEL